MEEEKDPGEQGVQVEAPAGTGLTRQPLPSMALLHARWHHQYPSETRKTIKWWALLKRHVRHTAVLIEKKQEIYYYQYTPIIISNKQSSPSHIFVSVCLAWPCSQLGSRRH